MVVSLERFGIDQLPVADRLELLGLIWDSVAAERPPGLTDAQREDLRRRAAEDDASPDDTVSWDEAVTAALRQAGA